MALACRAAEKKKGRKNRYRWCLSIYIYIYIIYHLVIYTIDWLENSCYIHQILIPFSLFKIYRGETCGFYSQIWCFLVHWCTSRSRHRHESEERKSFCSGVSYEIDPLKIMCVYIYIYYMYRCMYGYMYIDRE